MGNCCTSSTAVHDSNLAHEPPPPDDVIEDSDFVEDFRIYPASPATALDAAAGNCSLLFYHTKHSA